MIGFRSVSPTLFVGPSDPIEGTGKVGVGLSTFPETVGGEDIDHYRLFVKGGILTQEVRVRTSWADYVFDNQYSLKPLSEVDEYIEENGHLPNMPSAEEVEEQGIEIGEITRMQQEKIEELTLYVIALQKEIDELKEMIKEENN